jgi:hypothetical protein
MKPTWKLATMWVLYIALILAMFAVVWSGCAAVMTADDWARLETMVEPAVTGDDWQEFKAGIEDHTMAPEEFQAWLDELMNWIIGLGGVAVGAPMLRPGGAGIKKIAGMLIGMMTGAKPATKKAKK